MNQKKLIMIISSIIIVLVLLLFIFVMAFSNKNTSPNTNDLTVEENNEEKSEEMNLESSINLSLENEAKNLDEVNILIDVSEEIVENYTMILPDETTTEEHITEYLVSKNGEYKFTFVFENDITVEKSIVVSNIREEVSKDEPSYIPEDFSYKTGTIDTGYVIEDQYGNEFVWVPVESGVMTRKNSKKANYRDNESSVKAFINSVVNYHGFYISKYEASKAELDGTLVATSFYNAEPWYNISFKDAKEQSENFCKAFGYTDVRSMLTSSYAWDTTLNWLNHTQKSYSTSLDYGNYLETLNNTGATEKDIINNICDMAGNLKEWTTEMYDPTAENSENNEETEDFQLSNSSENQTADEKGTNIRILRGGSINLAKPATSQISFSEDVTDTTWGFRFVLYK